MGGFGSGRKSEAVFTENFRSIDIRRWQRDGLLITGLSMVCKWTRRSQPYGQIKVIVDVEKVRLCYSHCEEGTGWEQLDYAINLQRTESHYGGFRYWFICPSIGCGRRVALLYLGSKYFACRHCLKLVHKCQHETIDDRATRRADKIRERLGWEPGILNGKGWKPKGMHWRTYKRLCAEYDLYAGLFMARTKNWLNHKARGAT